jgi:hypothetical protein
VAVTKTVKRIWNRLSSGLYVPAGVEAREHEFVQETFLDMKDKAIRVERLYADASVPLRPRSDLARMLADAKALSDAWLSGQEPGDRTRELLIRGTMFNQIAGSLLALQGVDGARQYLKTVSSGTIDSRVRTKSKAKNCLWELEWWAVLRKRSLAAELQDPPDIVVALGDRKLAVACKRIYSEKHVQNVLSQAVKQTERGYDVGVVAINLDDLLPAGSIPQAPTHDEIATHLSRLNLRFIGAHERHLRKYLASGRLVSAIVSTGCVALSTGGFYHARQFAIWTIPGLETRKDQAVRALYDAIMRS